MKKFLLKKIIIISFFVAISFIIEIFFTKLFLGFECQTSLLKLELLPLILIGYFFGFKCSFFSNLLYIFIHIILESASSFQKHSLFKDIHIIDNVLLIISVLLFLFVIPYLSCSLTGFFYVPISKNSKNLYKMKNVWKSLSIITIIQIVSYFLFVFLFYQLDNFNEIVHIHIWKFNDNNILIFLYFTLSVILTNTIIGIILYFIKYIFKENIDFLYLE